MKVNPLQGKGSTLINLLTNPLLKADMPVIAETPALLINSSVQTANP